jgi:hypothetical protein
MMEEPEQQVEAVWCKAKIICTAAVREYSPIQQVVAEAILKTSNKHPPTHFKT